MFPWRGDLEAAGVWCQRRIRRPCLDSSLSIFLYRRGNKRMTSFCSSVQLQTYEKMGSIFSPLVLTSWTSFSGPLLTRLNASPFVTSVASNEWKNTHRRVFFVSYLKEYLAVYWKLWKLWFIKGFAQTHLKDKAKSYLETFKQRQHKIIVSSTCRSAEF